MGGGLSARGGGGAQQPSAVSSLPNPGAAAFSGGMGMDDEHGVRAAQPQVMDQLIGGFEEPM